MPTKRFLPYHVAKRYTNYCVYRYNDARMTCASKLSDHHSRQEASDFAYRLNGLWMRSPNRQVDQITQTEVKAEAAALLLMEE